MHSHASHGYKQSKKNTKEIEIENATLSLESTVAPLSESEEISYQENITSAEKSVTSAESSYNELLSSLEEKTESVEKAQKDVETAKTNMENYKILYEAGAESKQTYENYVTEYENQLSTLNSANRELTKINEDIESAKEDIEYAKWQLENTKTKYQIAQNPLSDSNTSASYQQQQNSLELSKIELAELKEDLNSIEYQVVAPADGTILDLSATENASVEEGNALYTYTDYSTLVVETTVSQYEIGDVYIGQSANMYTDDDVSKIYTGQIIEIGNEAQSATINNGTVDVVPVTISIDSDGNINDILKVGFSINVDIMTNDVYDVITVPSTSVITTKDGDFVFVVENDTLKKTQVEAGATDGSYTEVTGISEGTEVLITGSQTYEDGMSLDDIQTTTESSSSSSDDAMSGMPGGDMQMQGGGMQGGGGAPSGGGGPQ